MKKGYKVKLLLKSIILGIFALTLSNCGLTDAWFGSSGGPPLEGKRIAVSNKDKALVPAAAAKKISLNFPKARSLGNWQYPGGLTSNSPGNLLLNPSLKRIWNASAGSSTGKGKIATNPVIYNNMVYSIDSKSKVSAINFQNGKVIWRTSLVPKNESAGDGFGGGLSAGNGIVFATTGFGTISALDAMTGKVIWQVNLGSPIRTSPLAVDGNVFVVNAANMLTSLNQVTGEINWDYRRYEEISGVISNSSPAYYNGVLIVPFSNGEIVAVNAKDGSTIWGDTLVKSGGYNMMSRISEIAAKPVISDGKVYVVGNSGRMAALDLKKGSRVWTKDIGGLLTPAVGGNFVFVIDHSNRLIALTKKSGDARWVTNLNNLLEGSNAKWTGPIIANNNLYALSSKGIMAKISAENGQLIDTQKISSNVFIKPIIVNGTLVMLSDNAQLTAYR